MNPKQRALLLVIALLMVLAIPIARTVFYIVNEREMAVVLQFGDPVATRTLPGLYAKLPFVQEVRRLPKTYLFWEGSDPDERLVDVTTRDSKKIEATMWAVWRITDPAAFVRTLRTLDNAETRVKEFVRSTARDVLATNSLAEIVRSTNRKMSLTLGLPDLALVAGDTGAVEIEQTIEQAMAPEARQSIETGRKEMMELIRVDAQQALGVGSEGGESRAGRGIELVDVGLSRIDFVPEVRDAAFNRLIALMDAIATRNRSEGDQRKQEIINRATAEAEAIRGEGAEKANITRGTVEAEITASFAQAIEESGGFYDFNRTMELYKTALKGSDTRLIMSTDNPLLRLLVEFDPVGSPMGGELPTEPFLSDDAAKP